MLNEHLDSTGTAVRPLAAWHDLTVASHDVTAVHPDDVSAPMPQRRSRNPTGYTSPGLPGFRDRCTDASSTVYEDRRLAVRDDHPLDRQLRDPLE